ncbi:uncharacterized protein LOC131860231 [Cryptomeria japonica]|uniref:uncharacterized protein LOC131860231 n=1 Tax=Cryptomeria japonica TaxID=3369 RepID=UPI0027DA77DA|nr:uncharacterized protein LOC131860231 [Cryptomeria japonica]
MPTQPNLNPNNKPSQPIYNNEVANYPTYPINVVELEGVQLRSRKVLQGPTITEIEEEAEEIPIKEPPFSPPFPNRLLSKPVSKEPAQIEFDLMNELQNVNIKIPLLQAIKDIPIYNKTVQELCTRKKKKKEDPKTVQVIGQIADLMLGSLAMPKYSDPSSPIIKVSVGKTTIPNTLVDLGAAINVMTNETKEKLALKGLRPTPTVLQMADRSLVKPEGVIEDVVLSIDSWDYPTDFMILQPKVKLGGYPLILGRPWLAVANAFINCCSGNMVISNGEHTKQLTLYPPTQPMLETKDPLWIDSDLEDSLTILMIDQALDLEDPTEESILVNFLQNWWVSPLVVVPKKNGKWHICVDYRALNKATKKDHFPLPFIDQVLDTLAGKRFFSFLDGFSGYNQIRIAPEDHNKTTFTCLWGTFAYNVLPFGLCNALTTFQRAVLSISVDLINDCVEVYMDDFTTHGNTFTEAKDNLEKNFSKIALPLFTLLAKDVVFSWTSECQEAFETIKTKLVTTPVLRGPNWELTFHIHTNASNASMGAMLGQKEDNLFYSIYYIRKNFTGAEVNYMVTEKEFLVVVYAINKFQHYITSYKVFVHTNHSAICFLINKPVVTGCVIRWLFLLQEFDVTILDKPSRENVVADFLSRLQQPNNEPVPIFTHFGVPREITTNQGPQFTSKLIAALVKEYEIHHWKSTPYHPQANGQVEVTNRELENILTKTVALHKRDWAIWLLEAVWAYRTTLKTTTGLTPYEMVYGKKVVLPIEFEIKTLCTALQVGLSLSDAQWAHLSQLHSLDELRQDVLFQTKIIQKQCALWHDKHIHQCSFQPRDWALLYDS